MDTLAQWLYQRFRNRDIIRGRTWDTLTDGAQEYWAHEAEACKRAVARGGFKVDNPPTPDWAVKLVKALQKHEEEHAKETLCLGEMLGLVPAEVQVAISVGGVSPKTSTCVYCSGEIWYQECPTGGWWIHNKHPSDHHDAEPAADPLPKWLQKRYGHSYNGGDNFEAHKSFWFLEAAEVRRVAEQPLKLSNPVHPLKGWAEDFVARQGVTPSADSTPPADDHKHCSHYLEAEDDCCLCGRQWESPVLKMVPARLLDCGKCFEEDGVEVHPHPECPKFAGIIVPIGSEGNVSFTPLMDEAPSDDGS